MAAFTSPMNVGLLVRAHEVSTVPIPYLQDVAAGVGVAVGVGVGVGAAVGDVTGGVVGDEPPPQPPTARATARNARLGLHNILDSSQPERTKRLD
jgi:hypothetical protein